MNESGLNWRPKTTNNKHSMKNGSRVRYIYSLCLLLFLFYTRLRWLTRLAGLLYLSRSI